MKKKKIIILVILSLMLIAPVTNTYAKSCSSYSKKSKCNANSKCSWDKSSKTCKKASSGSSESSKKSSKSSNVNFCKRTSKVWKIVGSILMILKIVVPVLMIIYGSIDFGKAAISSKDEDIKKAAKTLMFRMIAGMVIFFIPTLVSLLMSLVSSFSTSGAEADYESCRVCLTHPGKCDTSSDASN